MIVAQTAAASFAQDEFFSGFSEFCNYFLVICTFDNGPRRNFQYHILAVCPVCQVAPAGFSMFCTYVLSVFEVDQSPELRIYFEYDMTSPASVASVGSAFWNVLGTQQMHRSGAAVARGAKQFYIVYKIGFRHSLTWLSVYSGVFELSTAMNLPCFL